MQAGSRGSGAPAPLCSHGQDGAGGGVRAGAALETPACTGGSWGGGVHCCVGSAPPVPINAPFLWSRSTCFINTDNLRKDKSGGLWY